MAATHLLFSIMEILPGQLELQAGAMDKLDLVVHPHRYLELVNQPSVKNVLIMPNMLIT